MSLSLLDIISQLRGIRGNTLGDLPNANKIFQNIPFEEACRRQQILYGNKIVTEEEKEKNAENIIEGEYTIID